MVLTDHQPKVAEKTGGPGRERRKVADPGLKPDLAYLYLPMHLLQWPNCAAALTPEVPGEERTSRHPSTAVPSSDGAGLYWVLSLEES